MTNKTKTIKAKKPRPKYFVQTLGGIYWKGSPDQAWADKAKASYDKILNNKEYK